MKAVDSFATARPITVPTPAPAEDVVLVRIAAASINRSDVKNVDLPGRRAGGTRQGRAAATRMTRRDHHMSARIAPGLDRASLIVHS
jgi:NADPH:quinone reductase-like Zn-dependent oxidoreductase